MNSISRLILSKILHRISTNYFPEIISFIKYFFPRTHLKGSPNNQVSLVAINTHDQSGGASKIAFQLSCYMRKYFSSYFFVGIKKRNETWIFEVPKMEENDLTFVLNSHEKNGGWLDFSKLGALQLLNDKFFLKANILHFHNLHGYYFSYALLSILGKGKRVIWTLHDEHILTGHCSFTMQCERWKIGCGSCPSLEVYPAIQRDNTKQLLYWKKKWINQLNPIIVSPSKWLADRVKKSYPLLSDVRVINNGIDVDIFIPNDKQVLREELSLPKDKFLVLFVAEFSTNNPFKGGELVREVIVRNKETEICFITIGSEKKSEKLNHKEIPYISDEVVLAKLYAACDVLFYPTNADNFPLVVLEAMSCGLPVIASDISGIPEIIRDNENGFLVEGYSEVLNYETKLAEVYSLRNSNKYRLVSQSARETIVNQFSLKQMLENYEILYRSLIN